MTLATDYSFIDIFLTMALFFFWVIWIWLLIAVFSDLFRRRDLGGGHKTLWVIFMIILPYLGVLTYLIMQSGKMADRNAMQARSSQQEFDQYVKSVASTGGAASEIEKAHQLLTTGAITQAEFDAIKQKALA